MHINLNKFFSTAKLTFFFSIPILILITSFICKAMILPRKSGHAFMRLFDV